MSKFKVGDKVKVVAGVTPTGATHIGKTVTITNVTDIFSYDLEGIVEGYGKFQFYDSEVELVGSDFEAMYNALVADLVEAAQAVDDKYAMLTRIAEDLLPKPKQYDVTVRVEFAARDSLVDFWGSSVQAVTEVTE